jgi:hypothetical protein
LAVLWDFKGLQASQTVSVDSPNLLSPAAPFRPHSGPRPTTFRPLAPCGFEEDGGSPGSKRSRTIPRQRARPAFPAATGADFSFASSDFKPWAPFSAATFATLSFLRSRARSAARPLTTSSGFTAPGTIPFPGANSIFSTCCGAISGRLRFAVRFSRAASLATETPRFKRPTIGERTLLG